MDLNQFEVRGTQRKVWSPNSRSQLLAFLCYLLKVGNIFESSCHFRVILSLFPLSSFESGEYC